MTANETNHPTAAVAEIDASCRVPMLALLVGAAGWLVIGTVLALIASIKFHAPDFLGACPLLTYGRVAAAANDSLVYGFCLPASLAVIMWIFSRLSQTVFTLPMVPVVAAHIWHLGVFIGVACILAGHSTGFTWLEFPRGASVLLFVAFALTAVPIVATFGYRLERTLYPSHWFLLAALVWFPWSYASANIFLMAMPVRGVAQAVIDLWFGNNLLFVWFSLVGLGIAFYFLPKLSGSPLRSYFYALFAFWTLILFGTWCGIPAGSPFPAWIPAVSSAAEWLLIVPVLAVFIIFLLTQYAAPKVVCRGGPLCFTKWGVIAFLVSGLALHMKTSNMGESLIPEFTWFGQAQTQLEIFGFLAMILFGALYYILPLALGVEIKLMRAHCWFYLIGVTLYVVFMGAAGFEQKANAYSPDSALPCLRISTLGLVSILIGNLIFALNIFSMFLSWKLSLVKTVFAAVTAPLKGSEVNP